MNLSAVRPEFAIQGSNAWMREFFGCAPGLCAVLDREGHLIDANRRGEADALLAQAEAAATVARAIATQSATQCDVALPQSDGPHRYLLLTVSPAVDGMLLATTTDITDRKREEQRLRHSEAMLVDTQGVAHLGVWEWDVTQPHAVWSPELYLIYGLDAKTHVPTYEDYLKRVHPDDRQRVIDATNAAFHDHKPYSHDERIYRSDGALRHLHTWAYPVLDASGKLTHLTGVCQDITDRKLAENAVVEHASELARANAELEQFARLAAHDLQEPLRTIASFVQILAMNLEGKLDDSSREAMGYIEQAVQRMKGQIADLLKYVKVAARTSPRTPVNVDEALSHVERDLHDQIVASGATIRRGKLGAVAGDPPEVESVLRSLIDNAIKFHGDAAPQIDVSAEEIGGRVEVVVRDNGIGIAPRHQERVFVVFQRLNPDLPGTGIGLAVCKKIVERSGGRIWLHSEPGRGTAVHFTLPAVAANVG